MTRIVRLPEAVANQIAAGEVVERPASVVKELIENAVDADAERIEIEIEDGGVALIRITDDGIGMSEQDALLSLERHATSKIHRIEDLSTVRTLGFRGEALPSIASVSRFTLRTRAKESAEGTQVRVEGGARIDVGAIGIPTGTTIEVRELFYNVPARRKFLKQASTELGHISDTVERLALARPGLALRLTHQGRALLDVPPASLTDPKGRLGRILGPAIAEKLYPVLPAPRGEAIPGVSVSGYVSAPELSERTPRGLHVFVNGRYVRDRTIQHAIQDAYRTLLERGRHPVVLLSIDVEPGLVDANVHPQKTEVRFADGQAVHRAVSRAIVRTLAEQPWVAPLGIAPPGAIVRRYALAPALGDGAPSGPAEHQARVAEAMATFAARSGQQQRQAWRPHASADFFAPAPPPLASSVEAEKPSPRFGSLEPIGQILSTYLVCEGPERMVLIDQHAAHERISFERMRRQSREGRVASQALLVPRTLELDAQRAAVAASESARLSALGFELAPFGGSTWILKSVPTALAESDVERVIRDVLDELLEVGQSTPATEAIEAVLSCAACHTVVRAGDRLERAEIKSLLEQMDQIDFGAHCPHGRPVYVEWSAHALGRLFHRE